MFFSMSRGIVPQTSFGSARFAVYGCLVLQVCRGWYSAALKQALLLSMCKCVSWLLYGLNHCSDLMLSLYTGINRSSAKLLYHNTGVMLRRKVLCTLEVEFYSNNMKTWIRRLANVRPIPWLWLDFVRPNPRLKV